MATKPSFRQNENRWISWVRVAKGAKGRKPIYGKTAEEALAKAEALEEELRGLAPPALEPDTFGWFVYNVYTPHTYEGLKKTSVRKYDSLIACHILPGLGFQRIADIGYSELLAFLSNLTRKDKRDIPLSDTQKCLAVSLAKEILELHRKLETAKGNVCREDWKIVPTPERPKKKRREEPQADFTVQFLKACEGTYMAGPAFAAMFLGLRRGEVCGLKWSDIDRDNLTITVRDQHQPEYGDKLIATKGEERAIPIPESLLSRLDALGDQQSKYVFTNKNGDRLSPGAISHYPKRLCEKSGLRPVTFHDLRSFAASNLAALGIDLLDIMEILGHKDIDTTLIYVNAKNEVKRKALEKLLGSLSEQVDKATGYSPACSQTG